MKKTIITILLFSIFSWLTYAQTEKHMFSVQAGGGLHHLIYSPTGGNEKGNAGFCLDLNYGYFFGKHTGLVTGLGIQSFKSTSTLQLQTSVSDIDTDGDNYQFRTTYNAWKESQGSLMLSLPVGVAFRGDWNKKVSWYAGTGIKAFIPLVSKYSIESGNIVTSGYYSQWDVELTDMPRHGFMSVEGNGDGDVKMKPSFGGFLNLGLTYKINDRLNFLAGIYGNYGMTSATDKSDESIYQKEGSHHSIINSNMISKTNVFAAGVQAGIVWHLGGKKKTPAVAEESLPDVVPANPAPVKSEVVEEKKETDAISIPKEAEPAIDPFIKAKQIANSTTIRFGLKSDMPYMIEEEKVKELSLILKEHSDFQIIVAGHTCDIASEQVNIKISRERAETVKMMFMQQGVPEKQIRCEAKAQNKPLVPNTSEANRAKNRRVELDIVKMQ